MTGKSAAHLALIEPLEGHFAGTFMEIQRTRDRIDGPPWREGTHNA
ncbi:hypothetical protein BJ994_001084 [Arthrobacter pigmenti]|uniref:Uncharacterized protein n=1 Tax=Arthrobacter pigmenti TaxID=271432 RepID=A0A846RFP8_9MICC|nr:hypothetical protein [Arthrobacter pigmenti]